MNDRGRLPHPTAQTVGWVVAGVVAAAWVVRTQAFAIGTTPWWHVAAISTVSALAGRLDFLPLLPVRGRVVGQRVSMHEALLVLALVVLPPGLAWATTVGGYTISSARLARRRKLAFNVGLWATTVAVAVHVDELLVPAVPAALSLRVVAGVTAAIGVHLLCNALAVQCVVAADEGLDLRSTIAVRLGAQAATWPGILLLGFIATALWLQGPVLALLAVGLALHLRSSYRHVVAANEALDEARIERDRLDRIVDQAADGIVQLGHDGIVCGWNATMAALTGVSTTDAIGRHVDAVLHDRLVDPGDGEAVLLAGASDPATVAGGREALLLTDGDHRILRITHTLQCDRLGDRVSDLVQVRDLTAIAESARLQDDFLARITHELRTPLTSIIGFGRTLLHRSDRLTPEVRTTFLRRLVAGGEALERLVDDLLLVASAQAHGSGRSSGHDQLQPLGPLVERAVELERHDHLGRCIEVEVAPDTRAVVDAEWCTTVVRHLVCNAVIYSDDLAPVKIVVAAQDDTASIRVEDEGRGIPTTQLTRIFERFSRLEDPLRMETRGAGLGLFIVDRLVARMGGHVTVESTVGVGSTFTVVLPRTAPDRPPHDHGMATAALVSPRAR